MEENVIDAYCARFCGPDSLFNERSEQRDRRTPLFAKPIEKSERSKKSASPFVFIIFCTAYRRRFHPSIA